VIRSLFSLVCFPKMLYMARMNLHMNRMPNFSVANSCCGRVKSHDASIGVKTYVLGSIP
jgi:hypothetical protein